MVDSIPGKAACALNTNTFHLILKSKTLLVEGNWCLEESQDTASIEYPPGICYDYLVNLEGVNSLIHPEDIPHVKSNLNRDDGKVLLNWKFRILTSSGQAKCLYGTGKLKEKEQHSNHEQTPRQSSQVKIF